MTILESTQRAGAFLLSEGNGEISRETGVLAATTVALAAGQVLGVVTSSGQYAPYTPGATNGTKVAAAILYAPAPVSAVECDVALIRRNSEVATAALTGADADALAALAKLGIIARA